MLSSSLSAGRRPRHVPQLLLLAQPLREPGLHLPRLLLWAQVRVLPVLQEKHVVPKEKRQEEFDYGCFDFRIVGRSKKNILPPWIPPYTTLDQRIVEAPHPFARTAREALKYLGRDRPRVKDVRRGDEIKSCNLVIRCQRSDLSPPCPTSYA